MAQLLGLPDDDVESLDWYEVAERFTDYGFDRAIVTLGAVKNIRTVPAKRNERQSRLRIVPTADQMQTDMGSVLPFKK